MNHYVRVIAASLVIQLVATTVLYAAPLAVFRLQVEDINDIPIDTVNLGQDFQLAAYVKDIRSPPSDSPGVWGAIANVAYLPGRVSITSLPPNPGADPGDFGDPGIEWGSYFAEGFRVGDLSTPGQIMAAGALSLKFAPAGLSEISLWKIKIHTSTLGTATFSPTFSPHPDVATYFIDLGNTPLTADQIQFIGDSVAIVVPEPSSFVLAALGLIGLVIWRRRKL